jgi:hypothetical protein
MPKVCDLPVRTYGNLGVPAELWRSDDNSRLVIVATDGDTGLELDLHDLYKWMAACRGELGLDCESDTEGAGGHLLGNREGT